MSKPNKLVAGSDCAVKYDKGSMLHAYSTKVENQSKDPLNNRTPGKRGVFS